MLVAFNGAVRFPEEVLVDTNEESGDEDALRRDGVRIRGERR